MSLSQPPTVLSLSTTVGSPEEARRLALGLLERRLAACVQIDAAVESHYRWQGSVQSDTEVRLSIKTRPEALDAVIGYLSGHHPYDTPQLLWQTLAASPAYAQWVRAEVPVPAEGPEQDSAPPEAG
ncbi:divalent-cation tolerance protein CutA [Ramlibacter sp. AN1015]|uniref:divalent-cation tolerance protein CutA n=1 Tax=Ramlibacter sp. AN1015 TaxID=3133428 RepID=UPI0030C23705